MPALGAKLIINRVAGMTSYVLHICSLFASLFSHSLRINALKVHSGSIILAGTPCRFVWGGWAGLPLDDAGSTRFALDLGFRFLCIMCFAGGVLRNSPIDVMPDRGGTGSRLICVYVVRWVSLAIVAATRVIQGIASVPPPVRVSDGDLLDPMRVSKFFYYICCLVFCAI